MLTTVQAGCTCGKYLCTVKRNRIVLSKQVLTPMAAFTNLTKILVPATIYNFKEDKRLIIPYTQGHHIGFINQDGEVVVSPSEKKYTMYFGECYTENDLIMVSVNYEYGYSKPGGKIYSYCHPLYGIINHRGEEIIKPIYRSLAKSIGNNEIFVVRDKDFRYGVINISGDVIVPFGKYDWIDGFTNGLARIKLGKQSNGLVDNDNKWGLIDINGNEVLSPEYDNIWNFYGKNYSSIVVVKNGVKYTRKVSDLFSVDINNFTADFIDGDDIRTYENYNGSYAQDVAGFSDQDIDDAFDGDPDAYCNID